MTQWIAPEIAKLAAVAAVIVVALLAAGFAAYMMAARSGGVERAGPGGTRAPPADAPPGPQPAPSALLRRGHDERLATTR